MNLAPRKIEFFHIMTQLERFLTSSFKVKFKIHLFISRDLIVKIKWKIIFKYFGAFSVLTVDFSETSDKIDYSLS